MRLIIQYKWIVVLSIMASFWMAHRSLSRLERANFFHERLMRPLSAETAPTNRENLRRTNEWYAALEAKYRRAMWTPWLPVPPQPRDPS